ncbi:hypothetical protein BH10PSE19_BH10PSE19_19210 [soil metagenome]
MNHYEKIKTHLKNYYQTDLIYLPLRIVLIIIIGVNAIAVILGVLGIKWQWDHPGSIPIVPLVLFTFISWISVIFASKIWAYKKWAFWGFCAASLAHSIFQVATKESYLTALSSLIVPATVFLCLQIGGKRKAWLKM